MGPGVNLLGTRYLGPSSRGACHHLEIPKICKGVFNKILDFFVSKGFISLKLRHEFYLQDLAALY